MTTIKAPGEIVPPGPYRYWIEVRPADCPDAVWQRHPRTPFDTADEAGVRDVLQFVREENDRVVAEIAARPPLGENMAYLWTGRPEVFRLCRLAYEVVPEE